MQIFAKVKKLKTKREYFVSIFQLFSQKNLPKLPNSSRLDSDFCLVVVSKLVFKLFKNFLETCCHLMLNPSWVASQPYNIRIFKNISWPGWLQHL